MIVVADTSPIHYLVLIEQQELLRLLFGQIFIPEVVFQELQAGNTPTEVCEWTANLPDWVEVKKIVPAPMLDQFRLDKGEKEAIQLAEDLGADLLLVDEKIARRAAVQLGLTTRGTLGVLDAAAEEGWIDFAQALGDLKQTNFHLSIAVEQFFLNRDAQRRAGSPN
jgi:predicted nucleic acid-binding protein